MIKLHAHLVAPVHLYAIDRSVDPATVRIAHDDDRARADEGAAVVAVPDRCRKLAEGDVLAADRVLQEACVLDGDGRARVQRLALLHPGLERVERPPGWGDPEREGGPVRAPGGVGEEAKAARKAFCRVEREPGPVGPPCRHFGDGTDLETRIGALDTPQRTELVDKLDEFAQVLVHCFAPAASRVTSIAGPAPCGQ